MTGFLIYPVIHSLPDGAVYFLKALCAAQQEVRASGTAITMLMMIILVMSCVCTPVIYTVVVKENKSGPQCSGKSLLECP